MVQVNLKIVLCLLTNLAFRAVNQPPDVRVMTIDAQPRNHPDPRNHQPVSPVRRGDEDAEQHHQRQRAEGNELRDSNQRNGDDVADQRLPPESHQHHAACAADALAALEAKEHRPVVSEDDEQARQQRAILSHPQPANEARQQRFHHVARKDNRAALFAHRAQGVRRARVAAADLMQVGAAHCLGNEHPRRN